MEKEILENKLKAEQETKDTEIAELKDEDMSTITAGAETLDTGCVKIHSSIKPASEPRL